MRKLLLLSAVFLFFTGCNQNGTDTPDAERVIRDTVAQNVFETLEPPQGVSAERIQVVTAQKEIPIKQGNEIVSLLREMKTAPQHFTIDNRNAVEVKGKNGTVLRIAANSFCNANGETIGAVELELKECYRVADLLAENLSTTTRGDAFETNGAVFVNATGNGQRLQLMEGRKIEVVFPVDAKEKGYCFYLPEGEEWQPYDKGTTSKQLFTKPEFSASGLSLKDYLLQILQYPDYAKANELSAKVEATIHLNEAGKVTTVSARSGYLVFRDEVNERLKKLPDWKPAMYGDKAISATVKLSIDFNLRGKEQIQVNLDSNEVAYLPTDKKVGEQPNDRPTATLTNTGWVCFGSATDGNASVADVIVVSDANTDVRLIVKGKNSVLNATNFTGYSRTFQAEENTEVDVLAIKCEGGKIFCSLQLIRLKKQNVIEPKWKQVSEEELACILARYPKVKA